ncbi:MAG: tRNA 4-thiouridine(8) synthase ThiI [Proteobacteria bacterium]|nr:tRNA 4-thiouridine(8) synthase ThiI [Pseudomonadota bacterium]
MLKVKAIALFSGGLDSILAVKVIQEQGIDVLGVTFATPFFGAQKSIEAAKRIGLPLLTIDITEEYLAMLKAPRYGYGRNMNPCIDCHTLMLKIAGGKMKELGADFLFTGEVMGQRPMSQGKQSLHIVAKNSGYNGYVLRPLSGRLLPETIPETEGKVDREKLFDIQGRGRKQQMEMTIKYGISDYSTPAGGCLLTDRMFSKRLKDLFEHGEDFKVRDIELLKTGRHIRLDEKTKIIVGRNKSDNAAIQGLSEDGDIVITMTHFPGPTVLVPYGCNDKTLDHAAAICALYSSAPDGEEVEAGCKIGTTVKSISTTAAKRDDVKNLII